MRLSLACCWVLVAAAIAACAPSDARQGKPLSPLPEQRLHVAASYPATLVWALDRATRLEGDCSPGGGMPPSHEDGYRAWLGVDERDERFAEFRERRPRWVERPSTQIEATIDAYLTCGLETSEVAELIACVRRALAPGDAEVAVRAIGLADAALRPKWPVLDSQLEARVAPIRELLQGQVVSSSLVALHRAAGLPESAAFMPSVVLVANPNTNGSCGTPVGTTFVAEVDLRSSPAEQTGIIMHEVAHFAVAASPRTKDIEPAMIRHGTAGVIAASWWNEAFASAFGTGWVISRLQPGPVESRSLFMFPLVDALAHSLVRQWNAGAHVELGVPLAQQLLTAMQEVPRDRWSVFDVFARSVAFASDESVAAAFQDVASPMYHYRESPLPAKVERPAGASPLAPLIYFVSRDELGAARPLLAAIGITEEDAAAQLTGTPAAVHWAEDREGVPLVILVGRDASSLLGAAKWLATRKHLPPVGWSAAG